MNKYLNYWEVEYPCGCKASSYSVEPLPEYCNEHGVSQELKARCAEPPKYDVYGESEKELSRNLDIALLRSAIFCLQRRIKELEKEK